MTISSSRAPGTLDPDFGDAGFAELPDYLTRLHPQVLSDQRILSVGGEYINNVATLIRHLGNGEIDTSYGNQGVARITLPVGPELGGVRHQLLADGSCLVSGSVGSMVQSTGFVFRVLANGELDSDFGESGFCLLSLGASTNVTHLGVLSDGKAMVTIATTHGTFYDFYLARLDNGRLDPLYGDNGTGMVHIGNDLVDNMLVLTNDAALVSTSQLSFDKAVFKQYTANGRPDSSFGNEGVFEVRLAQGGRLALLDLLQQPDGKIVGVGGADVGFGIHFLITRINAEGSMDNSFNNGEPKIMVLQGHEAQAVGVALQSDDKLVVVGTSNHASLEDDNFVIMRFLANSMLDSGFGDNGQVMTDFGARDIAEHVQVQADGNILVAGLSGTIETGTNKALLVRYLG